MYSRVSHINFMQQDFDYDNTLKFILPKYLGSSTNDSTHNNSSIPKSLFANRQVDLTGENAILHGMFYSSNLRSQQHTRNLNRSRLCIIGENPGGNNERLNL